MYKAREFAPCNYNSLTLIILHVFISVVTQTKKHVSLINDVHKFLNNDVI